jgi:hypothetical protein
MHNLQSIHKHRLQLERIGRALGVKCLDDWYKLTKTQVIKQPGGQYLLKLYESSLITALKYIFPEKHWDIWKFENVNVASFHFLILNNKNCYY